jgi:hypothetical protein
MFRSVSRPGALLLLALLTAACGDPPDREMHQAQGAIEAARAAGAAEYAAAEFGAAEAALQKSQAAVAERDYRQALSAALDARERARESAKTAAENRARARSEIDQAIAAAEVVYGGTKAALDAAVAAKVPAAPLASARDTLASARRALDTARAAVEAGDYAAARTGSGGVVAALGEARSQIDAAVQARATRRPARRGAR